MRILISGAAGFIGSHTANLLVERGHQVYAVDNFSTGRTENLKSFRGRIKPGDVRDIKVLDAIFAEAEPEAVLHLAAQSAITTSEDDPQRDLTINGIGTLNMLEASKKHHVKRFVFSSTSAVYSDKRTLFRIGENFELNPSNPYGISKLACERYIRLKFPNHLIMRYGNVYGPRQRPIGDNLVIARALDHFMHGKKFEVNGHGKQKRDFVYVGDVAMANMEALTSDCVGTFNVSSGQSYSVNEVLAEIEKIYGVPGYAWTHNKNIDPRAYVGLNVSSIRSQLGWKSYTPLSEGLKLTSEWWEAGK